MIAAGDWKDATTAYEQALQDRPRSGFALYGLALCSEKSENLRAAAKEYAEFLAAWKAADSGLAQVKHAQAYVAEHAALGG